MASSRKASREALAVLLEAALVGTGLPVKTVSDSKQTSLEGTTPLVTVLSTGSEREPLTFQGDQTNFLLSVQVWVLQSGTDWTLAQAEDALDAIEALIAATYESNRGTGTWDVLERTGPTTVVEVAVAGVPHYLENVPTRVRLAHT